MNSKSPAAIVSASCTSDAVTMAQVGMADIAQLLSDLDACWAQAITLNRLSQEPPQPPQFSVLRPVEGCEELAELMDALVECAGVLAPDELRFHVIRRVLNKASPARAAGLPDMLWLPGAGAPSGQLLCAVRDGVTSAGAG